MAWFPERIRGRKYRYNPNKYRALGIRNSHPVFQANVDNFKRIYLATANEEGFCSMHKAIQEYRRQFPDLSYSYILQVSEYLRRRLASEGKINSMVEAHIEYYQAALEVALEKMYTEGDIHSLLKVLEETQKATGIRKSMQILLNQQILDNSRKELNYTQNNFVVGKLRAEDVLEKLPSDEAKRSFTELITALQVGKKLTGGSLQIERKKDFDLGKQLEGIEQSNDEG